MVTLDMIAFADQRVRRVLAEVQQKMEYTQKEIADAEARRDWRACIHLDSMYIGLLTAETHLQDELRAQRDIARSVK